MLAGKTKIVRWIGIVCIFAVSSSAQELPTGGAATTMPADLEAVPFVDASFGFSLLPPTGFTTVREKRVVEKADVEVVRFVSLRKAWSLAVRFSRTTRPVDTQMVVDELTMRLQASASQVEVIRKEPAQIAGRSGVRFAARFISDKRPWYRQQAVIEAQPTEYYNLILLTPATDESAANALFEAVVASFKVLRTELMQQRLKEALDRGTKLLEQMKSEKFNLVGRLSKQETYLRFVQDGTELGFVRVNEESVTVDHRPGIGIREWGWLFNPDGSINHLQNNMFVACDLGYEKWDNRVLSVNPPTAKARETTLTVETAIRQGDTLLIQYTPQPNADELKDKAITVEPSYLSAALGVLMPRLLDLSQPQVYSFSSYSNERRGLALRTFQVAGSTRVEVNGRSVGATKVEDSEALLPPINEVDVDQSGQIVRVVAGPLEMLPCSREYIDKTYMSKVKDAQALLRTLPVRNPTPASRD